MKKSLLAVSISVAMALPSLSLAQEVDREYVLDCHSKHFVAYGVVEAVRRSGGGEVSNEQVETQRERALMFSEFMDGISSLRITSQELDESIANSQTEIVRRSQSISDFGSILAMVNTTVEEAKQCAILVATECMFSC